MVTGTNTITYSENAKELNVYINAFPEAVNAKTILNTSIDLGAISYSLGSNDSNAYASYVYYAGADNNISVMINKATRTIKIHGAVWGGTDISNTAQLIVTEKITP